MPDTPSFKLPYPTLDDTPDVPRDIKALADALDAVLKDRLQPMYARVTGRSSASAGWTKIPLTLAESLGSGWSVASNQLLVPTPGLYLVTATTTGNPSNARRVVAPAIDGSSATGSAPAWLYDSNAAGASGSRVYRVNTGLAFDTYEGVAVDMVATVTLIARLP